MATDERIAKYEDKMNKTMDALVKELGTIRAGRANPHILDKIIMGPLHHCSRWQM